MEPMDTGSANVAGTEQKAATKSGRGRVVGAITPAEDGLGPEPPPADEPAPPVWPRAC
jgi:hypothetical protein